LAEDDEEEEALKEQAAAAPSMDNKKVSVDELPLPTRTINALRKAGIETLSDLMAKSREELADVKNLGDKSIEEINKLLESEGSR